MKKILEGPSRRAGSVFQEMDTNFIEVCNCLLRIPYPECTLIGYAGSSEPVQPALNDCYLVTEDATIWEIEVEKNQILVWNGDSWDLIPFKITEISAAITSNDSHITRGRFVYHEQVPGQDTIGDWRQYADADNFYTQRCTGAAPSQGDGDWFTIFTFIS